MTTFVKICGLTDANAVHAAVSAGADAIGFVFFEKSSRNLTPDVAAHLAKEVPENVRRVAVMQHPEEEHWEEVRRVFSPDVLQTDRDDFSYLTVPDGIERWPVLREGAMPSVFPDIFIYEGKRSGHGDKVNWQKAADYARGRQMILAGGLTTENVADAIAEVVPFGVDVSSAVESEPGVKDIRKIAAFVKAAKSVSREE